MNPSLTEMTLLRVMPRCRIMYVPLEWNLEQDLACAEELRGIGVEEARLQRYSGVSESTCAQAICQHDFEDSVIELCTDRLCSSSKVLKG